MQKSRPTQNKRARERARQERQQLKAARRNEAKAIWASLPEVAPVVFNRGVAELFEGSPRAAQAHFKKAVALLPESSGWHHLAQLYLALASSR